MIWIQITPKTQLRTITSDKRAFDFHHELVQAHLMISVIKASQYKMMPWKNGLGRTSEIEIFPEGGDFTQNLFQWRLSSARIWGDNNFSKFPGYDRCLTVLSGKGLKLNDYSLYQYQIFSFKGEDSVSCSLIDDPVEDLGVIFDRRFIRCEMEIVDFKDQTSLNLAGPLHFLKPLSGGILVLGIECDPQDIVKIEGPESFDIESKTKSNKILKIAIVDKTI